MAGGGRFAVGGCGRKVPCKVRASHPSSTTPSCSWTGRTARGCRPEDQVPLLAPHLYEQSRGSGRGEASAPRPAAVRVAHFRSTRRRRHADAGGVRKDRAVGNSVEGRRHCARRCTTRASRYSVSTSVETAQLSDVGGGEAPKWKHLFSSFITLLNGFISKGSRSRWRRRCGGLFGPPMRCLAGPLPQHFASHRRAHSKIQHRLHRRVRPPRDPPSRRSSGAWQPRAPRRGVGEEAGHAQQGLACRGAAPSSAHGAAERSSRDLFS